VEASDPSNRVRRPRALLFHGAGSSASTAESLLGRLLRLGWEKAVHLTCYEDRTGDVHRLSAMGQRYLATGCGASSAIGGISLGAHGVMTTLLRTDPAKWPRFAVVAMPAWLGPPDRTAQVTLSTGREIATSGVAETLRRIEAETHPTLRWIPSTLAADWAQYEPSVLSRALITAAQQIAPSIDDLRAVRVPTFVIAVTGDALHPADVAHLWADALPHSVVVEVELMELAESGFALPRLIDRLTNFVAALR